MTSIIAESLEGWNLVQVRSLDILLMLQVIRVGEFVTASTTTSFLLHKKLGVVLVIEVRAFLQISSYPFSFNVTNISIFLCIIKKAQKKN